MTTDTFYENVVIITGASSGIGRQLALQLAKHGAWLVLAARQSDKLMEVAKCCRENSCRVLVVETDIGDKGHCQRLIASAIEEYGRIDTLVNNAGVGMYARLEELHDVAVVEEVMRVNFMGSVYSTYYALPYLIASKGRLIGISSHAGKFPAPKISGYCASKFAMAGFYDSLRLELRDTGVSVTMVYFGFVKTGMGERALGADGQPLRRIFKYRRDAMTVEKSADVIIDQAWKRKREYMPLPGRIGLWFRLISPAIIDRVGIRVFDSSASRRVRQS